MILEADTALNTAQYDALLAATGDPSIEVLLEQYSLSLVSHDTDGLGSVTALFDVVVSNTTIVRAYRSAANTLTIGTLATEDGGDQSWSNQNLVATNISTTVPLSIVAEGADVRVFWYDGSDIKFFVSVDMGANWGGVQTAFAMADVQFLGAVMLNRFHYITLTAKYNHRFHVATYNGSWSSTDSELYWPYPLSSFDAIVGAQVDDAAAAANDILVFDTDYPPVIGIKIQSTELVHTISRVQGIAVIRYQNGRWSNHYEFDVVDRSDSYPARSNIRLTVHGGYLFMAYTREDGTTAYPHTSTALSRSKDGIHWELPYLLTSDLDGPLALVKRGDHAYLINSWKTWRSPSVGYTADSQVTQDITAYATSFNTKVGDIQQFNLAIGNPESVLDATSPFGDDVCLQARVSLGYKVAGTDLKIQTLLADVDTIGGSEQMPTDHEVVSGRDYIARLLAIRADEVIERNSQIVGGDDFESSDDTDYSGMRHTAPQDGAWKAPSGDNELLLVSNQAPGLAFNTYCQECWNGSCQTGFRIVQDTTDDYAGLIFRAYDKHNHFSVKYDAEEDKIKLYSRKDNQDLMEEELAGGGTMSWSVGTWYYLKATFRYSRIRVYSSTDNITWTEQIDYEPRGVASGTTWSWEAFIGRQIENASGRMGYIGHGYSDETDKYPDPPGPLPPRADPPETGDLSPDQWIFGTDGKGVFYTENWEDANPDYFDMSNGLEANGAKQVWDLKRYTWPSTGVESLFACTDCGLYEYTLPAGTGEWVKRLDITTVGALVGASGSTHCYSMITSIEFEGWMWATMTFSTAGNIVVIRSEDGFKTYQAVSVVLGRWFRATGIYVAQHSAGQVVYLTYAGGASGAVCRRSADQGATWSVVDGPQGGATADDSTVFVPYVSPSWDDRYVYWGCNLAQRYSDDYGATWATVSPSPAFTGSKTKHLSGPTFSPSVVQWRFANQYEEYHKLDNDTVVRITLPGGVIQGTFVKERNADLTVQKIVWGRSDYKLYETDVSGGTTDKTGDWATVTGSATTIALVVARFDWWNE